MDKNKIYSKIQLDLITQDILPGIRKRKKDIYIEGVESPVTSVLIDEIRTLESGNIWVVFPTFEGVKSTRDDLRTFEKDFIFYPSTEKELYSTILDKSINTEDQQHRLHSIRENPKVSKIILTTVRAFISPVVEPSGIEEQTHSFSVGKLIEPEKIADLLGTADFLRVPRTTAPGEFSIRGEVIDLFCMDQDLPIRIFLDWDRIENIVFYDPISQESVKHVEEVTVFIGSQNNDMSTITTLKSYIKKDDVICYMGDTSILTSQQSVITESKARFPALYNENPELIRPSDLLLDIESFQKDHGRNIHFLDLKGQREDRLSYVMGGPRSFFGNINYFREEIDSLLDESYDVIISAGSKLQQERLINMIHDERIMVLEDSFSSGFNLPKKKLIVICEHEIFGRRRKIQKAHVHYKSSPLDSFIDLNQGDFVVHINYGIGRFTKIDRIKAGGKERDYIDIEYANEDHIFIPIEQANLVQRYIGSEGKAPRLDTIGGKSWEGRKAKARKSAEDLAKMLIELYAKRQQTPGFPFAKDTDWQIEFEAAFPYEETEDQLTCIQDVKDDMESTQTMDRLICGDVGFGKTEIAIRAAFKAVMSGKQVALLAPTTILAEQHFETLKERIGSYPIGIGMLSRFVTKKEQKKTVISFNEQKLDILVGTHRIIQKDLNFKNLGLMIVDEEQRFGVKDKERIKQLRTAVDSLALSATPIPRTLYMSLLKIREMSLLTTPPFQRRPIKTVIEEFDEELIAQAIRKEVARGGQVFFLHNRIRTLEEVHMMLRRIVPEISVDFAHGQMDAIEIEEKMRNFVHGAYQVLVATTIIENGIDIPNVNTIIIDRADIYGISQLYQLRGRVGRSNKEAYAILLYPSRHVLSEIAMKRLKILSEHTNLGSGFKIAMKDMEIRGAGNLLGREQHGQMSAVGLDMYLRILDEAIADLSDLPTDKDREVYLDLDYSGYIPDEYIKDPSVKFDIYKKIASISSQENLMLLEAELEDRFGKMPEDMTNLLYIAELKILCKRLSIFSLKERRGTVSAEFSKVADISIERVLQLIRESNGQVTIDQKTPNIMLLRTEAVSLKDKSLFILERLQRLL